MRNVKLRRLGLTGAVLAAGLLIGSVPAQAATPAGVAGLGSAKFTRNGQTIEIPAQAFCNVDGPPNASSGVVAQQGISFGGGTSTCTRTVVNPATHVTTTKSAALGRNFQLSALMSVGGPRIHINSYRATCVGRRAGTTANWGVSGVAGLVGLPQPIPTGFVSQVKKADGTLLATFIFGERILPNPPDGGVAMNALHIRFEQGSGINGEVILGSAACAKAP
jgi:hypothetical protein